MRSFLRWMPILLTVAVTVVTSTLLLWDFPETVFGAGSSFDAGNGPVKIRPADAMVITVGDGFGVDVFGALDGQPQYVLDNGEQLELELFSQVIWWSDIPGDVRLYPIVDILFNDEATTQPMTAPALPVHFEVSGQTMQQDPITASVVFHETGTYEMSLYVEIEVNQDDGQNFYEELFLTQDVVLMPPPYETNFALHAAPPDLADEITVLFDWLIWQDYPCETAQNWGNDIVWESLEEVCVFGDSEDLDSLLDAMLDAAYFADEVGDLELAAWLAHQAGLTAVLVEDSDAAYIAFEEAIRLHILRDDTSGAAAALHNLGVLSSFLEEPDASVLLLEQAVTLRQAPIAEAPRQFTEVVTMLLHAPSEDAYFQIDVLADMRFLHPDLLIEYLENNF